MEPGISDKNHNDFHWKNKLEDADSLSVETLMDKNAAWEKLHSRLRQRPRRIKTLWYWAAAACLLLAIFIPMIRFDKQQDSLVKNNPTKILPQKSTFPEILPVKENAVANISPGLIINEKQTKPSIRTKKKSGANDIVHKEDALSPGLEDQKYVQQQPAISSLPVIDSPVETALAAAPLKKELKVVHINELTDPNEETLNTVRYYERRSFKLKLINREPYTSSSPYLTHTGFNFLKPKH